MTRVEIGTISSRVSTIDSEALVTPAVMSQILAAVLAELENRERNQQYHHSATRIGSETWPPRQGED